MQRMEFQARSPATAVQLLLHVQDSAKNACSVRTGYVFYGTLVVCCSSYRIQRKVVSLCVYKDGDWLQLSTMHDRYDSINTLVMYCATTAIPIPVGDHVVFILTHLRHPVHSSQYYKQRSSHTV